MIAVLFLDDGHRSRHVKDVANLVAHGAQLLESGGRRGPVGVVEQLERAVRVRRRLGDGEQRLVESLGGVLAHARHRAVAEEARHLREETHSHRAALREKTGAPAREQSTACTRTSNTEYCIHSFKSIGSTAEEILLYTYRSHSRRSFFGSPLLPSSSLLTA